MLRSISGGAEPRGRGSASEAWRGRVYKKKGVAKGGA